MPDVYVINYTGLKPRPTCDQLIYLEDYPAKYPDRSATCTRDSPLLTQFNGVGMINSKSKNAEKSMREKRKT